MTTAARKPFTGYHMTAILVVFFGVVIAVNLVMARAAIGSFGGTVVENSYVASQQYNQWLDAADQQAKLGWSTEVVRQQGGRVAVKVNESGRAGSGFAVTAVAQHPLGRAPQQRLEFNPNGEGTWVSIKPLPPGRWTLHLGLRKGEHAFKQVIDLP